jgi:hypothetical protein
MRELDPKALAAAVAALFKSYNDAIASGKKLGSGSDMAEAAVRAYLDAMPRDKGPAEEREAR